MEPAVKDFHHPYKPYDIQLELMNVVYQCVVEGKVGILESPTGLPPQFPFWLAHLKSIN